uniref:Centaurin-gamma-1A n=1 Tax=Macrostomum lignano TaxID=282301 RepID=A0A1I8HQR3_9PLAT
MAACSTARRCQTPTTAAAVAGGAGRPSPSHHHQQQQQQQHRALLGAYNLPPPGQGHASAGREYQHQVLLPASLAAHQYYEPAAHSLPVQQQASPQQLSSGKKTSDSTLWDHRPAAGDPGHNTSMASGQPAYYSSVAGSAAVITASASCNQPQQQPPLGMRGSRERASYAHGVSFVSSGYLYKRSAGGALSRADWKKKYAALAETGQLTYYSSLHDYMADSHGKTIDLRLTTVKVPGQTRPTSNGLLLKTQLSQQQQQSAQSSQHPQRRRAKSSGRGGGGGIGDSAKTPDDDCSVGSSSASGTPAALGPPGSGFEFTIVSLDNRTWQFEAPSQAERDDWVRSIEQGILRQLQLLGRDGNPVKNGAGASSASNTSPLSSASGATAAAATASAAASVQLLRDILGNNVCADCGRPDPDWASINLGVLLCIECSGVHRNLGTHLSRVRSLNLDDWPANNVLVMRAIGNRLANSVWEACLDPASGVYKPNADSPRELKEQFIRAKYERREFLPELPYPDCPIQQQLVDAIARSDTRQVILCLAVAGPAVNRAYSQQDPRAAVHIAATLGQLPYLQLLLWYGADPAVRDAEGRTGHFYAAAAGKPDCAEFLLLAGCPPTNLMSTSMATATNNTASTAAATNSSVSSSSRRRSSRTASPTSPTNATMEIGL